MTDEQKLYETMGELLYVIAKADGVIQEEENAALKELLKGHKWAEQIEWSFNYEVSKEPSVNELYDKVIAVCHRIGPSPIYNEFVSSMEAIANANEDMDDEEAHKIASFSADLIERFKKDLEF